MSDDTEWGPWIDHDGEGCPVKGQMVTSECADGRTQVHIAHGLILDGTPIGPNTVDSWNWADCFRRGRDGWRVIRYRVRKPKGMVILQQLLESLPSDVKAREPA